MRREARVSARLDHPNVAAVYDYGEARLSGLRRVPFLVLQYVDGETLADRLRRGGPPAVDSARRWRPGWPRSTRRGWSIAMSSRATCCSRPRGRNWSIWVWRSPSAPPPSTAGARSAAPPRRCPLSNCVASQPCRPATSTPSASCSPSASPDDRRRGRTGPTATIARRRGGSRGSPRLSRSCVAVAWHPPHEASERGRPGGTAGRSGRPVRGEAVAVSRAADRPNLVVQAEAVDDFHPRSHGRSQRVRRVTHEPVRLPLGHAEHGSSGHALHGSSGHAHPASVDTEVPA